MYLSFCTEERGAGGGEAWKFGRIRFEFVWVEGLVVEAACASHNLSTPSSLLRIINSILFEILSWKYMTMTS